MPTGSSVSPAWLGRVAALIVLVVAGIWFSTAVTLGQVIGDSNPEKALVWGNSAEAQATMAQTILQQGRPGRTDLARARRMAEGALLREPVNVAAARSLALVAGLSNDRRKTARLMHYAESLSRRDALTQFWLIEEKVERNDIDGALRHYDRALRSSPASRDTLLPILVQASADPAIARPLAALLAARPAWWEDFTDKLLTEGNAPATMTHIVRRLRLNPDDEMETLRLRMAMDRLVDLRAHRRAYEVYRQARGGTEASRSLVRDGGFEGEGGLPPFEWRLSEEPSLGAIRELRPDGAAGMALSLIADSGRSGEVARQLLVLPAGSYELSALAGNIAEDRLARPVISVTCAGGQPVLVRLIPPTGPASGATVRQRFTVPAGNCAGQWLSISIGAGLEAQGSSPAWIDSIALRPL